MKNIYLLINSHGQAVKCFSSLKKAYEFAKVHNFHFDYAELTGITEMEVNGESWGIHHSFDEFE